MSRKIAVVLHPDRNMDEDVIGTIPELLRAEGLEIVEDPSVENVSDCELILVLGGDGTILRAAELGRPTGVPILGINYGHIGFLSEADPDDIPDVVKQIAEKSWTVEERMTIDVTVELRDGTRQTSWALNEASIERENSWPAFEAAIGVDGRELSAFKVDTVLFSTATGSTAYNFSGGGPIVWPDVEAMVLTPIAAHALFTRPLVVGPNSQLELYVLDGQGKVSCDSRRFMDAPKGSVVTAVRGKRPVLLARLDDVPFSGRLVTKLQLPVRGWRDKRGKQ